MYYNKINSIEWEEIVRWSFCFYYLKWDVANLTSIWYQRIIATNA